VVAYERLSEPIKVLLEGLRAEHSGYEQAAGAIRDGKTVRREPVKSQHPIVRVHPVSKNCKCIQLKTNSYPGHQTKGALRQSGLH
jgi:alpha-ketoglutarate-dependent taurine dioxygenase